MDYEKLGARIRQQRQKMSWTQETLAKETGMSTSFIGHIERGTRTASVETLVQISNAMSVSLDELLADSLTWREKQFQIDAHSLPPDQFHMLCEALDTLRKSLRGWNDDETPEN